MDLVGGEGNLGYLLLVEVIAWGVQDGIPGIWVLHKFCTQATPRYLEYHPEHPMGGMVVSSHVG